MLSAKKLEDKTNDQAANSKGSGSQLKNGVLVTAKPQKSRFCIPNKVSFQIPFYKEPNPYAGLNDFMTWENSGICRGNVLDEKQFMKLSPAEQAKCHLFEFEGQNLYAQPKDTARGIVVKHLGRQVSFQEFFTPVVFTQELLEHLDKNVIGPMFKLPDRNSFADIEEIEDALGIGKSVEDAPDSNETIQEETSSMDVNA